MPFFIKIAESGTVQQELNNYENYAEFFIPFYLRPNLDRKRSVSTGVISSIVGNLVEDSQPLRFVLRSNPGPGIIFSLFENSLKGFRLQPLTKIKFREGSLEEYVKMRSRANEVPKQVTRCARLLGLKMSPLELEGLLCEAVKGKKCRLCPHHADLHPGNVLVRGKDAILIDFSAVNNDGPIIADPAAIEIGLVFGTDEDDDPNELPSWRQFVNKLYHKGLQHQPPPAERTPGPHTWLRRAIREIRHISLGCNCSMEEKNAVYSAYLIRFARLPIEKFRDKNLNPVALQRHAYALVAAERIIQTYLNHKVKVAK